MGSRLIGSFPIFPWIEFKNRQPPRATTRSDRMSTQNIISAVVAVVVLLFILGASPLFVVDLTQTAIVVQLGKPVRSITQPGLQWKVPFIQDVTYFDKRLLDYDSLAQDVITQDKKTLLIDNFAKWRITDPLKVYQAFQTQRSALKRLDDIIYSELRVEVGRHDLSEIVSKTRSDIMAIVTQRANEKALAYGIEIVDVRIKRADLPEQNEKAVFARMQAEPYKTAEQLRGEGDAQAFKQYADAYRQDPKFFEFTRSMEAYKKTFNGHSTLILTPDSEFFKYLKQR